MGSDLDGTLAKEGLAHDLRNALQTIRQAAVIALDPMHRDTVAAIVRGLHPAEWVLGFRDPGGSVSVRSAAVRAIGYRHGEWPPAVSFRSEGPDIFVKMWEATRERALVNLFVNAVRAARSVGMGRLQVVSKTPSLQPAVLSAWPATEGVSFSTCSNMSSRPAWPAVSRAEDSDCTSRGRTWPPQFGRRREKAGVLCSLYYFGPVRRSVPQRQAGEQGAAGKSAAA